MINRTVAFKQRNIFRSVLFSTLAFVIVVLVVGLLGGSFMFDAAGLSKAQARNLELNEQYHLFERHFNRMNELTEELQLSISPEEWGWADRGMMGDGTHGIDSRPGSNGKNSYYLSTVKFRQPDGARGGIEDLDPLIAFFVQNGWRFAVSTDTFKRVEHTASAVSPDGWHVRYTVRDNGHYTLAVISGTFWGDREELRAERHKRMPPEKANDQQGCQHTDHQGDHLRNLQRHYQGNHRNQHDGQKVEQQSGQLRGQQNGLQGDLQKGLQSNEQSGFQSNEQGGFQSTHQATHQSVHNACRHKNGRRFAKPGVHLPFPKWEDPIVEVFETD
ncbi:MAG TPA: hypothetical protein VLZ31_08640 [Microbacteriaceae bacterium]|nr:hypothetical protein [Microbacteriaceae bacterium]